MGHKTIRDKTAPVAPSPKRQKFSVGSSRLTIKAFMEFRGPGQETGWWEPAHPIRIEKARVELGTRVENGGGPFSLLTSAVMVNSEATLNLSGVNDGEYTISLWPPDKQLSPGSAGPHTNYSSSQKLMYRPVHVSVSIEAGRLKTEPGPFLTDRSTHAKLVSSNETEIRLDWKPDWWACYHFSNRNPHKITHIVVHHIGNPERAPLIMSQIDNWKSRGASSHYVINRDGHIVKAVEEKNIAWHAYHSFWKGKTGVSHFSVGIEQVNNDEFLSEYTEEQYDAMIRLVGELVGKYHIDRHNVVGHSSILIESESPGGYTLVGRDCPGQKYDWKRLEDKGLATKPLKIDIDPNTVYGGFFSRDRSAVIRGNDHDFGKGTPKDSHFARYGGVAYNQREFGDVISTIQADLSTIGFSVSSNNGKTLTGVYDLPTQRAVSQFQIRFLSGTRRDGRDDAKYSKFDLLTATTIQQVLADIKGRA